MAVALAALILPLGLPQPVSHGLLGEASDASTSPVHPRTHTHTSAASESLSAVLLEDCLAHFLHSRAQRSGRVDAHVSELRRDGGDGGSRRPRRPQPRARGLPRSPVPLVVPHRHEPW